MKKQANINHFLNLKFEIIKSLKIQGYKEDWMYPFLKGVNIHKIHFNK